MAATASRIANTRSFFTALMLMPGKRSDGEEVPGPGV